MVCLASTIIISTWHRGFSLLFDVKRAFFALRVQARKRHNPRTIDSIVSFIVEFICDRQSEILHRGVSTPWKNMEIWISQTFLSRILKSQGKIGEFSWNFIGLRRFFKDSLFCFHLVNNRQAKWIKRLKYIISVYLYIYFYLYILIYCSISQQNILNMQYIFFIIIFEKMRECYASERRSFYENNYLGFFFQYIYKYSIFT